MKKLSHQCEICKVFSNPVRLGILLALRGGPRNVTEIIGRCKASQSVVSQHLTMMRARGILSLERRGSFAYYALRYPEIMDAFDTMRSVAKKLGGRKHGQ
jgi:ArsR family transcriptional regulator